ncbi:MAG: exodeoxyribonuclease VII small subunit, partial [Clostridia bacterium]|nr:exodeoxyribonuclease VII small subunit [Clostridia bacterium]
MEFEKMLKRIEEIVIMLEGGNCGLEEATNIFEEGKNLAVECFKKLDES